MKRNKETMLRVHQGQGRLEKEEWKPALALMYPKYCFLAAFHVCFWLGLSTQLDT